MPRIILNAVPLQQDDEFLLKRQLFVMLGLLFDVCGNLVDVGLADRERTVTLLPREIGLGRKGFVDPFGCEALPFTHGLGHGEVGGQDDQAVDVVLGAADGEGAADNSFRANPAIYSCRRVRKSSWINGRRSLVEKTTCVTRLAKVWPMAVLSGAPGGA